MKIKITGDDPQLVKELFDGTATETTYGCEWILQGEIIRCDTQHGDGIAVEPDAIIIKGEMNSEGPLSFIQNLSRRYPNLTFELQETELTNLRSQRWIFDSGEGRLLDCIQDADNDEPRIDYMVNGVHFLPLPDWVPAIDDESNRRDAECGVQIQRRAILDAVSEHYRQCVTTRCSGIDHSLIIDEDGEFSYLVEPTEFANLVCGDCRSHICQCYGRKLTVIINEGIDPNDVCNDFHHDIDTNTWTFDPEGTDAAEEMELDDIIELCVDSLVDGTDFDQIHREVAEFLKEKQK